jgi:hypothetical protein
MEEPMSNPVGAVPEGPGSPEVVHHAWEARVRVLANPAAWRGVGLSLGGGALALGVLFTAISKSVAGLYLGGGLFAGLMLLFVLIGGVIDLCGGFRVRFLLTSRGVYSLSGKGARAAANTALVGGLLTGNLAGMGAGALARAEQTVFIPYGEVTRLKAGGRHILVKGGWAQKPIRLDCPPEEFPRVLQFLRERCPGAAA